MPRDRREQFRQFVTERTPELFGVAYALAGRQDAAEKLLQAALERTWLRWRRMNHNGDDDNNGATEQITLGVDWFGGKDDPYGFTVRAMRRGVLPWWRRWRPGAAAPMPAAATGGRAVDLADLALTGAMRRRLTRIGSVVAAAAVIVAGVAVAPGLLDREQTPEVDLTGRSVVAIYSDNGDYVLNPVTGEYVRQLRAVGTVSPDLRYTATIAPGRGAVRISSTIDDAGTFVDSLPLPLVGMVAWSPDSSRLAVTSPAPAPDLDVGGTAQAQWRDETGAGFDRVVLVDAGSGGIDTVELALPDDHVGWIAPMVGAFWADADHLAAPLIDLSSEVPDPVISEYYEVDATVRVVTSIGIFDTGGALVDEVPMPNGDLDAADNPHAGVLWLPTGLVSDDLFLLARAPSPGQLQLATIDRSDPDSLRIVRVFDEPGTVVDGPGGGLPPWPYVSLLDGQSHVLAMMNGSTPFGDLLAATFLFHQVVQWPYAWLADGRILAASLASGMMDLRFGQNHVAVNLDTGTVEPTTLVDEVAAPDGTTALTFADAAGLAPAAGGRALLTDPPGQDSSASE